jgi:putative transposase
VKPELLATRPNAVWSWDITKLLGPVKWTWFYLYTIIDIYSRYVPGWLLARAERALLAERLLADTIAHQHVDRGQLTIHADRGSSMASKPVAFLLADLGVTKSHSRPHCSNDNPYSEAQFKTLKYRPEFPERFGCYEDALAFCRRFFGWYNADHRHSGIGFHTPADVHYGRAELVRASGPGCWRPPTPPTPSGSSASHQHRPHCQQRRGSTSHSGTCPAQRILDQPVSPRLTASGS